MKQYIFFILLPFVFGCTKNKTFNNKYFTVSVPTEFKVDSINLGQFSSEKFPGRELIIKDDLESFLYSFYLDNKNPEEKKGFSIANSVIENKSKKDDSEIILNELKEQQEYFSQNKSKKFELILPLKDTVVQNRKYSYYIYAYSNLYDNDSNKTKRGRLFIKTKEKIHDIDLVFNTKDKSSIQNQFKELFSIVSTITFKK